MKKGNAATPNSRWSKYNRQSCDVCKKILYRGNYSRRCHKHKIVSYSTRIKMSVAHTGLKHNLEARKRMSGENAPNWKGGITEANKLARNNTAYQEWRRYVFKRDGYRCLGCGVKGVHLQADHILPFAYFPRLRYDTNNGQTLCISCHEQTPTFKGKAVHYAK